MVARSALLIVLGGLIAAVPATASAAVVKPPAPTPGLTAARSGSTLTIAFTPQATQAAGLKPGKGTSADCAQVTPDDAGRPLLGRDPATESAYASATVAADGTITYDLDAERHDTGNRRPGPVGTLDVCTISRSGGITGRSTEVGYVALTPAGTTYYDERAHVLALKAALLAGLKAGGGYEAAAQVPGVVALAAADATPPAGQVGYWTDGRRAAAVTLSAAGRRLFLEDQGGLMIRTDAVGQLDALFLEPIADSISDSFSSGSSKNAESDGSPSPYGEETMPQGEEDGVRMTVHGRRITVRFTGRSAKALKTIGGRKVRISCFTPAAPTALPADRLVPFTQVASAVTRVPRHGAGGAITARFAHPIGGICDVTDEDDEIASGTTTPRGRVWMQDQKAIATLPNGEKTLAAGGQSYATAAQIAARDPKHYVALKSRGATPPVGRIGVWTDGAHAAELVNASASGHRFVEEDQGAGIIRTNLFSQLFTSLYGI